MKEFLLFLILVFYNQINYCSTLNRYIYSIEEAYKILNNIKAEESDLKIIIDSFITLFNEAYAYMEVAKNPPQPKFNDSYFEKVDIEKELRSIPIKDTNMFKFYQALKLIFDRLGDQHLTIDITSSDLKNIFFECPIKLIIKKIDDEYRIFGIAQVSGNDQRYFRNYETVFNTINNNLDVPIYKINGKDPFDYVTEFAGKYEKYKSLQGTFRFKFFEQQVKSRNFFDYPLNPEEFYNFTVEYLNGEIFTTDYVIHSSLDLNERPLNNDIKTLVEIIKKKKEANMTEIYKDIITFGSNRLFDKLYSNEKIKESILGDSEYMDWNYKYSDEIACKVDDKRRINIYGVLSFGRSISNGYIDTVAECTKLFDGNIYPIIVINIMNGGGLLTNSQFLIETVSPRTTVNIYAAYRNKGLIKDTTVGNQLVGSFLDIESCESLTYKAFKKKNHFVNYGNSVSDEILGPIFLSGSSIRKQVKNVKDILKNPRKPTDIILFTDGFSYSATSLFLKYLQYYGGAITAGYFPNPNLEKVPYDSGLSPSSILTQDVLKALEANGLNDLDKYKYNFIITGSQTFYTPNNFNNPLEYEVTPVDERVNVYINDTSSSYYRMNYKEYYEPFINESLRIIEKYKTQCNKDNPKLLLVTEECDGHFKNSYTHGGYACGSDGLWTKNCVASYCDFGYVFDHTEKKCIVDTCKPEDPGRRFYIVVIIIIVILVSAIIAFIICCIIHNKRKKERLKQFNLNAGLMNEDNQSEEKTDV